MLIEKESSEQLDAPFENDDPPLHLACKFKSNSPSLLEAAATADDEASTSLVILMLEKLKQNSNSEKRILFRSMQALDGQKKTVLQYAIEKRSLTMIEAILQNYYEANRNVPYLNGNLPVHLEAKFGSSDVFRLLVKYDAVSFEFRNNSHNENALHIAAKNNHSEFIKTYLEYEQGYMSNLEEDELPNYTPSVQCLNCAGQTPLVVAIINENLKCVEQLAASKDIDLRLKDQNGYSVYHTCAQKNNVEALRFLLKRKDPKFVEPLFMKSIKNETPVHLASANGSIEIIKLIMSKLSEGFGSKDAYVTEKDGENQTCLHLACVHGFFNIVEYLIVDLKMSFLLESRDKNGNTALHLASSKGYLPIVNVLLQCGANLETKNDEGCTALELSCSNGFFDCAKSIANRYVATNSKNIGPELSKSLQMACMNGAHEVCL